MGRRGGMRSRGGWCGTQGGYGEPVWYGEWGWWCGERPFSEACMCTFKRATKPVRPYAHRKRNAVKHPPQGSEDRTGVLSTLFTPTIPTHLGEVVAALPLEISLCATGRRGGKRERSRTRRQVIWRATLQHLSRSHLPRLKPPTPGGQASLNGTLNGAATSPSSTSYPHPYPPLPHPSLTPPSNTP